MIWIDYAILSLLALSAFMGLIRGVAAELFALSVWLIAGVVGLFFCKDLSEHLAWFNSALTFKFALAFISLNGLTLLLGAIIAYLLYDVLMLQGFRVISRLLGSLLGVLRGGVITTILVLLAGMTPLPLESWWQESQIVFPFQKLAQWLSNGVPSAVAEHIKYQ